MSEKSFYITLPDGSVVPDLIQIAPENRGPIALLAYTFCIGGLPVVLGLLRPVEIVACTNTLEDFVQGDTSNIDGLARATKNTIARIPESKHILTLEATYMFDAPLPPESLVPRKSYPPVGQIRRDKYEMARILNTSPENADGIMTESARSFVEQAFKHPIYQAFGSVRYR